MVFWKPLYNLVEGTFTVLVVNAAHITYVPGRKTDVKDAKWIAELLAHGLLRPSFVPPAPQRALRDLTRQRTHLIQERASVGFYPARPDVLQRDVCCYPTECIPATYTRVFVLR